MAKPMTNMELLGHIGHRIKSAHESYTDRMPTNEIAFHVLDDIEDDLNGALNAIKELFYRRNRMNDIRRKIEFKRTLVGALLDFSPEKKAEIEEKKAEIEELEWLLAKYEREGG